MNFLKKLFGGGQTDTPAMPEEAAHQMETSAEEAETAMHDAAAATPAEAVVDEAIEHTHEAESKV